MQHASVAVVHCDLRGVTCPLDSIATDSKSFASGKTKPFIGAGEGDLTPIDAVTRAVALIVITGEGASSEWL